MYSTGYTPRSGNFSNGYPKPGYETNMPSIHSAVPGTGYSATSPYRPSWGAQGVSFESPAVKMNPSSEMFDSRNSVGKQVNGYGVESGWVCNSTDQRMCYGECKRSGRMCVSCQEYAQYNYGMQTINSRCSSQMVSPPYPQRQPSWHEGQNMAPQKFSPNNGYHLPRSNSEPSAYTMNGYSSSYQQTNSSHWGTKTAPPGDAIRRSSSFYTNGYSHGQHTHGRCVETDNWQSYRMTSCDINSQKMKTQMRPIVPQGAMGPHHRNNPMTQQNSHFNPSMNWNNQMNIPVMPNSQCAISQDRIFPTRPTCANRPEQLQARGCSFPTTPSTNSYGVAAASKPMGSCQLSQVPHPVMSSPPKPQRTATFWEGPSPITKQSVELEKFQYTSANTEPPVDNTNSQFHQSTPNGQSPSNIAQTCPGIPQNCDLSDRAWQNDIVDLNSTGCEVNDKARIFSAELEKLARLSQTFDGDELDFSNATDNATMLSSTGTPTRSDATCTNLTASHVPSREESCFDEPASTNTYSPRSTDFNNMEQSNLPCVSEANILPQQIHEINNTQCGDTNHDIKGRSTGSNSVMSPGSPNDEGDGGKLKTKHTDYLDQTSDVNPYGSQNCIAALSASCRKMIADMDKPGKDSEQSGQGPAVPQQPMCGPSFPDGSPNGVTNSSCYGRPYGTPSHPHSFPVDPYTLHYPQVPHISTLHGTISEKSRRGRKRKNAVGRGSGNSSNRGYDNQESCKKSFNTVAPSSHESLGNDFEGPRSPHRHASDTDLGNISPTFSDGPVSFDMLESVFSPDNSLSSAANDFSTILETSNNHLSHSFSDFGHTSPPSVAHSNLNNGNIVSSTRCLPANVTSCQPASTGPNSKERHPLEILKDQIKIQRQQFSLDGPMENGPAGLNERNNNKADESGEMKSIHHDVNDNHVIESRS